MVIKWIKAIFTKPLVILKSIYYNIFNKHEDLATKRLKICQTCPYRISSKFGYICDSCGCILENKVRVEDEVCDMNKW